MFRTKAESPLPFYDPKLYVKALIIASTYQYRISIRKFLDELFDGVEISPKTIHQFPPIVYKPEPLKVENCDKPEGDEAIKENESVRVNFKETLSKELTEQTGSKGINENNQLSACVKPILIVEGFQ